MHEPRIERRRVLRLLASAFAGTTSLAAMGCELAADKPANDARNPPFVPTSPQIVEAMLRLADTSPEDIVYDLGSGDGRIPITAADKFDVRLGVGVELDRDLIRVSEERARELGVENRVQFIRGDIFRTDISQATVVTLFLMSDVNAALRPLLLKNLKPGTRVVGHMFSMGDWLPDKEMAVADADPAGPRLMETDESPIYLWIVPAEVAGSWRWATAPGNTFALRLQQKYQFVTGDIDIGRGPVPIREGRLSGNRLGFKVFDHEQGRDIAIHFDGTVDGGRMRGVVTLDGRAVPFSAQRQF